MSALRLLTLFTLVPAAVFVVAAAVMDNPQAPREAPFADKAREFLRLEAPSAVVRLSLAPPDAEPARAAGKDTAGVSITMLPDLSPQVAPGIARNALPPIPMSPRMDGPSGRAATVALRLRAGLTPEMLQGFDLFVYVSKAERGPLAQRLYVFHKTPSGGLNLLYDWAVSTGRERSETSPRGLRVFTATPAGYYQLDPRRMYRAYHSTSWDQEMPHALFFNWKRAGVATGLAIHAATGDDVARLGRRASAGCVHLAPENAAALYELIRMKYRGPVPRLAYNAATQALSNRGAFMHDAAGRMKTADGYRVLVDIEDYGGEKIVASLF